MSLVVGDSVAGTVIKIGVIIFGLVGASVLEQTVYVYVWFPGLAAAKAWAWKVGWVLFSVVAAVYVLWFGGITWVRTRGPHLWVDTEPIVDEQHNMFRLMVKNLGNGVLQPNASLEWAKTKDGSAYHGNAQLPGNLEWTHLKEGTRPKLSWKDGATFAIAYINTVDPSVFAFAIEHYRLPANEDLTFCIKVTVPGTRQHQERIFSIRFDEQAPLKWRCKVVRLTGW